MTERAITDHDSPLTNGRAWRIYGELAHNLGDAAVKGSLAGVVCAVFAVVVAWFEPRLGAPLAVAALLVAMRVFGTALKNYGVTLATKAQRG